MGKKGNKNKKLTTKYTKNMGQTHDARGQPRRKQMRKTGELTGGDKSAVWDKANNGSVGKGTPANRCEVHHGNNKGQRLKVQQWATKVTEANKRGG